MIRTAVLFGLRLQPYASLPRNDVRNPLRNASLLPPRCPAVPRGAPRCQDSASPFAGYAHGSVSDKKERKGKTYACDEVSFVRCGSTGE